VRFYVSVDCVVTFSCNIPLQVTHFTNAMAIQGGEKYVQISSRKSEDASRLTRAYTRG